MLQFIDYKKFYGPQLILDIPKLEISEGLFWVKGANGAGKTTLLKCMAGLLPFNGDLLFDNTSVKKQRQAYLRSVAFAEAEPQYPAFLTGWDLIHFFQQTRKDQSGLADQLLTRFGMNVYIHSKIETYSSGMMKKLSLLLAFLGAPRLILLDEPLITLDAGSVQVLIALISEYRAKEVSFFMSTHQEPVALDYEVILVENKKAVLQ